jgi:hypothetical protein
VIGPVSDGDGAFCELESGDGKGEEVLAAGDVGNADRVALGEEVVHFGTGKAFLGQLTLVWLFLLIKLQWCKMVEGFGLNLGQVEAVELLIECLPNLLGATGRAWSWSRTSHFTA